MPFTGLQGPVLTADVGTPPGNSCETVQLTSLYELALRGRVRTADEKGMGHERTHVTLTTFDRVFSAY